MLSFDFILTIVNLHRGNHLINLELGIWNSVRLKMEGRTERGREGWRVGRREGAKGEG